MADLIFHDLYAYPSVPPTRIKKVYLTLNARILHTWLTMSIFPMGNAGDVRMDMIPLLAVLLEKRPMYLGQLILVQFEHYMESRRTKVCIYIPHDNYV